MKILRIIVAAVCAVTTAVAQTSLLRNNTTQEVNLPFSIGTGKAITWKTGSSGVFQAGSTVTISGVLNAAPTGTFDFTNMTVLGVSTSAALAGFATDPSAHPSFSASAWRTDLGLVAIATSGSASDLTSGTVPVARLPTATTSTLGAVKVDGTSITITNGVISASGTGTVTGSGLTAGQAVVGAGGSGIATTPILSFAAGNATVTGNAIVSGNLSVAGNQSVGTLEATTLTVTGNIHSTGVNDGDLYIGRASTGNFIKAQLSAGSGVTITPGPNSISISASGSGGTLTASGPPTSGQIGRFTSATNLEGVTSIGSGNVVLSPGGVTVTTGKVLSVSNNVTLTATDGSTLAIGGGGTLGSAAYTASSAYEVPLTFSTGLTRSTNTITVNATQSISKLSNLSTNGVVTTTSGDGTLAVVTTIPTAAPSAGNILVGNAGGTAYAAVAMSGDSTLASTGAITLATVNSNVGTFGNATTVPVITVNGKGLVTAVSNQTISASGGGTKTLARWSANDNNPPAANYAEWGGRNAFAVLAFDAGTDESAIFQSILPEATSLATGISVIIKWVSASATSGDVIWTAAWERSNTDIDSDSFAAGISGTTTTNGTSGVINTTTINFNGTTEIDGLTAGDVFRLKITRDADAGGDTMTGDAHLIAVEAQQR